MEKMMRTRLLSLAVLAVMSACAPAFAQTMDSCHGLQKFPHEQMVDELTGTYGEHTVAVMLENQVNPAHVPGLMMLWFNPEQGTWSLTVTDTNMMTCLLSAGRDVEFLETDVPQGTLN